MNRIWGSLALLLLLLLAVGPAPAAPVGGHVSWSIPQVSVTLDRCTYSSPITVSFISSEMLEGVQVSLVPELSPYLTLSQAVPSVVLGDQPYPITLSFAVPPLAVAGTYAGTIHVRSGNRTIPTPLEVVVNLVFDPSVTACDAVTDPEGDGEDPYWNTTPPDFVWGAVEVVGGVVTFKARFAPGTFDAALTGLTFNLDTDQNPATGKPGVDSGGNDAAVMGTDYLVSLRLPNAFATIYRYDGCPPCWTAVGSASYTLFGDGVDIQVPLSLLGADDEFMNFKVLSATRLSSSGWTTVADYMPNLGLPPGMTH